MEKIRIRDQDATLIEMSFLWDLRSLLTVVFLALGAKVYHSDHPNLLGAKRPFSGAEVSSTVDT